MHAYTKREFTLILCINSRLFDACIHACTKREVMSEDSDDIAFLIMIFRVTRIFPATTARLVCD